jgi:hypothetical protein
MGVVDDPHLIASSISQLGPRVLEDLEGRVANPLR